MGCGAFGAPPPERVRGIQRRHVRICMRKGRARGSARPGQDRSAPPPAPPPSLRPPPAPTAPRPPPLRVPCLLASPLPPEPRPLPLGRGRHSPKPRIICSGPRAHLHDKARVYLARAPRRAFVPDQMTAQLLGRAPHPTLPRGPGSLPRQNVPDQRGALWGSCCTPDPALPRSGRLPGGGGVSAGGGGARLAGTCGGPPPGPCRPCVGVASGTPAAGGGGGSRGGPRRPEGLLCALLVGSASARRNLRVPRTPTPGRPAGSPASGLDLDTEGL